MEEMSKHQQGGLMCPKCGCELELNPVDHDSEAEPTMEEAEKMPLKELRDRLPKKSEE